MLLHLTFLPFPSDRRYCAAKSRAYSGPRTASGFSTLTGAFPLLSGGHEKYLILYIEFVPEWKGFEGGEGRFKQQCDNARRLDIAASSDIQFRRVRAGGHRTDHALLLQILGRLRATISQRVH